MAESSTITITDETATTLVDQIRQMFGRAIEEDGRLADADDAMDDLCNRVADRVNAFFAALATGGARHG